MPSAIDTRITLTGLADAKAKLQELGAGGKSAMGKINQSTAAASEGTSKFSAALGELGEKLGLPVQEAGKLGDVLGGLNFESGIGGLAALGAAIVAAGVAFFALGEHAATATRELENHARTLGITSEAFEGLSFAAGSVGVSADSANRAFDRLYVKIGAAREEQDKLLNGGKAAFDATKAIVDQIASVHGDFTDTLAATADAMMRIEDPARRAALGMKLMGRSWAEQMPLLALGGDGIRKLAAEWKALGITATEEEGKMATAYAAAASKLKLVTEGLTNAVGNIIGQLFVPGMDALAKTLSDAQSQIRAFAEGTVERLRPLIEIGTNVFRGFSAALQDMTAVINRVFGTNFSTVMVVATALLVAFARPLVMITGAFLLVEAAIKTVFGPDSPIDAGKVAGYVAAFGGLVFMVRSLAIALQALWLNPFGVILAGALALGAVLLAINGDTKAISDAIGKYIGEDAARSFDGFVETVRGGWEGLKTFMAKTFQEWTTAFENWLANSESAAAGILRLILKISNALGAGASASGGGAGSGSEADSDAPISRAGGGHVPGRGSGDTVRALLTPGEFVQRVAAVNFYGPGFMERLNNLQIPRFNLGGLVGSVPQHFASGGLVAATGGGGNLKSGFTLAFGGEQFGVESDRATALRVVRHARSEDVRRGGKMPSWST